ncbi:unnamed protein product [Merluccius merluccius]
MSPCGFTGYLCDPQCTSHRSLYERVRTHARGRAEFLLTAAGKPLSRDVFSGVARSPAHRRVSNGGAAVRRTWPFAEVRR